MERHLAPFRWRQTIASIVRRRSRGGVLPLGRHASISGSSAAHSSFVTAQPHQHPKACEMGTLIKS
jgi:hypothetical protein